MKNKSKLKKKSKIRRKSNNKKNLSNYDNFIEKMFKILPNDILIKIYGKVLEFFYKEILQKQKIKMWSFIIETLNESSYNYKEKFNYYKLLSNKVEHFLDNEKNFCNKNKKLFKKEHYKHITNKFYKNY